MGFRVVPTINHNFFLNVIFDAMTSNIFNLLHLEPSFSTWMEKEQSKLLFVWKYSCTVEALDHNNPDRLSIGLTLVLVAVFEALGGAWDLTSSPFPLGLASFAWLVDEVVPEEGWGEGLSFPPSRWLRDFGSRSDLDRSLLRSLSLERSFERSRSFLWLDEDDEPDLEWLLDFGSWSKIMQSMKIEPGYDDVENSPICF